MARLTVNPDTPDAWSVELPLGDCSVGRGDQNQVVIDHPSVSSSHCRLTVSETHAVLRDSGSTGGTFVRGELVEEARLVPGSVFRLGEVQFRFESDAPAGSEPPLPPPLRRPAVSLGTAPRHCKWHPQTRARFHCPRCKLSFCDLCVERRSVSGASVDILCRKCGSACNPVADVPIVMGPPPAFASMLPGAFLYPWKGNGVILLVGGAVFFLLLSFLPLVGLLITGYLFSYAKKIVAASATGKEKPPDWPDFNNWVDDILVPYFHLIALVVLTFGPAWVLAVFMPAKTPYYWAIVIAATTAGAFLAPMGMLALAMFDTVSALNPMTLIWSIQRIPWHYLVAALAFGLVIGAYMFCDAFVGKVFPVPILGSLLAGCLNLYLLAVAMRILGLLYWSKKEELGWFGHQ